MKISALVVFTLFAFVACNQDDGITNSPPTMENQSFEVSDIAPVGTAIGRLQAVDLDEDVIIFTIAAGNIDSVFALNTGTGDLTLAKTLDFDAIPTYVLSVEITDGLASSVGTVTIDLVKGNIAPVVTDQEFEISEAAEEGAVVGMIVAADGNGDDLTFEIASGNTNSHFALDPISGELSVAGALDYNEITLYEMIVEVSDAEETTSATITVVILNENVPPDIELQTFEILEDADVGTEVGIVTADDEDQDELSFAILAGNSNSTYSLDANTGELKLEQLLNHATDSIYVLTVEVSDGLEVDTDTVVVTVTEVVFQQPHAAGSYLLTHDGFGGTSLDPTTPIVVVDGTEESTMVFQDIFAHGYDMAMTVESLTGIVTIERQEAFDTDVLGLGFGIASLEGEGTYYCKADSCSLSMDVEVTIADGGSFGVFNYKFEKQ